RGCELVFKEIKKAKPPTVGERAHACQAPSHYGHHPPDHHVMIFDSGPSPGRAAPLACRIQLLLSCTLRRPLARRRPSGPGLLAARFRSCAASATARTMSSRAMSGGRPAERPAARLPEGSASIEPADPLAPCHLAPGR